MQTSLKLALLSALIFQSPLAGAFTLSVVCKDARIPSQSQAFSAAGFLTGPGKAASIRGQNSVRVEGFIKQLNLRSGGGGDEDPDLYIERTRVSGSLAANAEGTLVGFRLRSVKASPFEQFVIRTGNVETSETRLTNGQVYQAICWIAERTDIEPRVAPPAPSTSLAPSTASATANRSETATETATGLAPPTAPLPSAPTPQALPSAGATQIPSR